MDELLRVLSLLPNGKQVLVGSAAAVCLAATMFTLWFLFHATGHFFETYFGSLKKCAKSVGATLAFCLAVAFTYLLLGLLGQVAIEVTDQFPQWTAEIRVWRQ